MSRDNADGASMGFRSSDEFNNWLKDAPKVDERNAAAPTPPVQDGWFDMKAVRPRDKDGNVLLYSKAMDAYWVGRLRKGLAWEPQPNELAWLCASSGRFADPSHWMPLPAVPAQEGK